MLAWLATVIVLSQSASDKKPYWIDPPPGWEDVTAQASSPEVLLALKGPETSSFMLLRAPQTLPLSNRAAVRSYLEEVLAALKHKSGVEFVSPTPLLSTRF